MRTRPGLFSVLAFAVAIVTSGLALASPMRASAAVSHPSPASASIPANFSRVPASWHGYAPKNVKPGAVCSNGEAVFNQNSGKVIEVYDSATTNGAEVDQWTYNGTQTQHWCFFSLGTWQGITYYQVVNNNSGKCLDMTGDNLADGTLLQQWSCLGDEQQQWIFLNEGSFDLFAPLTARNTDQGIGYGADVTGRSTANGARIQVWSFNEGTNQHWCPGAACS